MNRWQEGVFLSDLFNRHGASLKRLKLCVFYAQSTVQYEKVARFLSGSYFFSLRVPHRVKKMWTSVLRSVRKGYLYQHFEELAAQEMLADPHDVITETNRPAFAVNRITWIELMISTEHDGSHQGKLGITQQDYTVETLSTNKLFVISNNCWRFWKRVKKISVYRRFKTLNGCSLAAWGTEYCVPRREISGGF